MSHQSRPKLTLKKSQNQIFLEWLTFACVAFCFIYPAIHYSSLPEQVPMHFNYKGEVDRYGSKSSIWILSITSAIIIIGLYKLSQYPHIFNYPVEITENNAEKHYKNSVKMLTYMNVLVAFLFALICYQVVNIALNKGNQFGQWTEWAIYIVIGLITIAPIIMVIKMGLDKDN